MTSGIYKISYKDVMYVGSAVNFDKRWKEHKRQLSKGVHHSAYMQNVFNKYGLAALTFEVIEVVEDTSNLIECEQVWLDWLFDTHEPSQIFNSCRVAGSVKGIKRTPEQIEKIRQIALGRKASPETIEKQRKAMEQRYADKVYSFRAPDGTVYENIKNLSAFAREHGLHAHALRGVLSGVNKHCHGWTLPDVQFETYSLISPDGTVFENIVSLREFAEEHGLTYKNLHLVWKGKRKSCKGWRKN